MSKLPLGAGQDQQVAKIIGADRGGLFRERLQHAHHLARADVAQRDDLHRKARRQRALRVAELRRDVAAHRNCARQDLVEPALLHHRGAVHPQQRFECGRQRVTRDSRRCPNGDHATDRSVDHVALVEDVAQDVLDHFAQIGAFEIQDDVATGRLNGRDRRQASAGHLALDDHTRSLEDARAVVCRIGRG